MRTSKFFTWGLFTCCFSLSPAMSVLPGWGTMVRFLGEVLICRYNCMLLRCDLVVDLNKHTHLQASTPTERSKSPTSFNTKINSAVIQPRRHVESEQQQAS